MSLADLGPSQEEVRKCKGEGEEAGKFENPWGSGMAQSSPRRDIPATAARG